VTRPRLRSLLLLAPLIVACSSGGTAGPGGGSSGGSAGNAGVAGSGGSGGGSTGTAGTSGAAGTSGGAGEGGRGGGAGGGGAGGTAGAAGSGGATAGASGTGGVAGARGGSGGAAGGGAAGSSGTGGSAGASGTTGAGGTGGSGGTNSSSLRLEYQNSSSTATTFGVRLTNVGPAMPLISAIKVRYYFRDDSTNRDATPQVTAASWKLAGTSTTINLLLAPGCGATIGFATPPQSSYADYGCNITSPMNANDTITFTLAINPATQLASNDYSYADTAGAFAPNEHLLILLNGVTVAGTAP